MRGLLCIIGLHKTGFEEVMRAHGLEEINGNWERFPDISMCTTEQLIVIGDSISPGHVRRYLATWVSSDHATKYQIDHICMYH